MTIEKVTRPYETLIRHFADGTIGAHHQTITELVEDGVIIGATANHPISIAGADLKSVFGKNTEAALNRCDALTAENKALKAEIKELQDSATEKLKAAEHEIHSLKTVLNKPGLL